MIPYIAILIVVLVAILFSVYRQTDSFVIQGVVVTESTPVQTVLDYVNRYLDLNQSLQTKLSKGPSFDAVLPEAEVKALGLSYTKGADGSVNYTKPLSKALSTQIELDVTLLKNILDQFTKKIASGDLKSTMTVREVATTLDTTGEGTNKPMDLSFLNETISNQVSSSNAREALVNKYLSPKTPEKETPSAEADTAPPMTPQSTKEMEERIAKSVATQVKDSLLLQRATTDVTSGMPCPYAPYDSEATAQGQEYNQAKPNPAPDMSEYIRKDSIPCWNCSLP